MACFADDPLIDYNSQILYGRTMDRVRIDKISRRTACYVRPKAPLRRSALLLATALASAWPITFALGQTQAAKPDLDKAEKTAKEVCVACHGADGNSPSPTNPSL